MMMRGLVLMMPIAFLAGIGVEEAAYRLGWIVYSPTQQSSSAPPPTTDLDTQIARADALLASSNYARALAAYREVLTMRTDDPSLWYRSSQARGNLQDFTGMIKDLDRALALQPTNHALLASRANAMAALRRFEEAIADMTAAIAAAPQESTLYRARADLFERLGRNDDALSDRRSAVMVGNQKRQ